MENTEIARLAASPVPRDFLDDAATLTGTFTSLAERFPDFEGSPLLNLAIGSRQASGAGSERGEVWELSLDRELPDCGACWDVLACECQLTFEDECESLGAQFSFLGAGTWCSTVLDTPVGACCFRDGCQLQTCFECTAINPYGFLGPGTECDSILCYINAVDESNGRAAPEVALSRPMPNPTTGTIAYRISVQAPTRAEVSAYDAAGRLVDRLLTEELPAGNHTFSWVPVDRTGEKLWSGLYFLRLNAGGHKITQRCLILQ